VSVGLAPPADSEAPALPGPTACTSRAGALALTRKALAGAGLEEAAIDARILLSEALGIDPSELALRPQVPIGQAGARRLAAFTRRRLAREPVSRILGQQEFWGLPLELSPATLVPRPDSETVVEAALRALPDPAAGLRVLDLGTGSGCLLIALLHELRNAHGIGVDRSVEALATARRNAQRHGVSGRARFVASDWASAIGGPLDLIVANPPYIPSGDIAGLADEVRLHDPEAALDGGRDGLVAYRAILTEVARVLDTRGLLVLEIGVAQASSVAELASRAGYEIVTFAKDLAGLPRALVLTRPRSRFGAYCRTPLQK
jgi:release factor glutamine methyltransferase